MIITLKVLICLLTISAFYALLLTASHYGEQHRCQILTAHASPAAATYDCQTTVGH
jgi:hypothetical protein